jgi:hypothetical protein
MYCPILFVEFQISYKHGGLLRKTEFYEINVGVNIDPMGVVP